MPSITSALVLFKEIKLTHRSQRHPKLAPASENLDAEPLGSFLLTFYCRLHFTTSKMEGGGSALIDSGRLIKACNIFIRAALVSH